MDIEKDAIKVLDKGSPSGSRQIFRKYNEHNEYVPFTFSDLTTPTPQNFSQGFHASSRNIDTSAQKQSSAATPSVRHE